MRRLESEGRLDRGLEFLPSDEELEARRERGEGLTRPELAVLVSYAKIELKQALAVSDIVRQPGFSGALHSAFPPSLLAAFPDEINSHPLRAEVSATQIANDIVNRMGITWFDRMRSTTGADAGRIAAAYLISLRIHDVDAQWKAIEALDGQVDASVQADLYADAIRLVTRSASWLLQNRKQALDPVDCVAAYRGALADVLTSKSQLESVIPASRWQERYAEYGKRQVPDALSLWCASAESRYWLMDMVEIARQLNEELASVAWVYFTLGESLNLTWLDRQMRSFRANGHWQVLATIHFRDELDHQLRNLTFSVFSEPVSGEGVPQARLEAWRQDKRMALSRWQRMLSDMQAANEVDCAVFSVAHGVLRELAAKAG
jgi:glutamate dehydrogenase